MKQIIKIIITALILCKSVAAQEISKLTLPASPAFSILNFEPSAVMRPTNAKSLATDVLNSFDEDGKLIMNLGLETAPFWLVSHPKLKMKTYLNPRTGQTFLQSFKISAATVKDTLSGKNDKFGAGFRFKLYNGKPIINDTTALAIQNLKIRSTINAIINGIKAATVIPGVNDTKEKAINAIEGILVKQGISQPVIDELKKMADEFSHEFSDSIADIQAFLKKLTEVSVDSYKNLQAEVSKLLYDRKGFIVEFAGAFGYRTSGDMRLEKTGIWGNISNYVSPDDLFTLTARYMSQNNDNNIDTANFDIGLGYLKKTERYNVSIEGMFRWYKAEIPVIIGGLPTIQKKKDFTYRLAVQGSYIVSKDISINLNFGKDFSTPFSGSGFFSILGLNYSIFNKKIPELPAE